MTADPAPAAPTPGDDLAGPAGADAAVTAIVHLVRHGEVANPQGVIYGRLPGYHLSQDGELMAKAAADYLAARDVTVLRSSPLDRARETAAPIAQQFGLEIFRYQVRDRHWSPTQQTIHISAAHFADGASSVEHAPEIA